MWFTPLTGAGTINGLAWAKGDCALTVKDAASILLAAPR